MSTEPASTMSKGAEPINWNSIIWNATVLILSILILAFGAAVIYFTPQSLGDVVNRHGIQLLVVTLTLPVVLFLLALNKISNEAGLSLLGAVIGYAFGKAT
jgi:hypothetical protein